jgi:hypothetical protein
MLRMKLAIRSIAAPARMDAPPTNHGKRGGQTTINRPTEINVIPGIIITIPERGFSIMPLQVSAIGHMDTGAVCAILASSSLRACPAH